MKNIFKSGISTAQELLAKEKLLVQELIEKNRIKSGEIIATDKILADEILSHTLIVEKLNVLHKQHTNTIIALVAVILTVTLIGGIVFLRTPKINKIDTIDIIVANQDSLKTSYGVILSMLQNLTDIVNKQQDLISHSPIGKPLDIQNMKNVSSKYGPRVNSKGEIEYHKAIDISAKKGSALYAMASGTVIEAKFDDGWGNTILVDTGIGYQYRISHMDSLFVKLGQKVVQGEMVGKVGNTGNSFGDHADIRITFTQNGKTQDVNPSIFI